MKTARRVLSQEAIERIRTILLEHFKGSLPDSPALSEDRRIWFAMELSGLSSVELARIVGIHAQELEYYFRYASDA